MCYLFLCSNLISQFQFCKSLLQYPVKNSKNHGTKNQLFISKLEAQTYYPVKCVIYYKHHFGFRYFRTFSRQSLTILAHVKTPASIGKKYVGIMSFYKYIKIYLNSGKNNTYRQFCCNVNRKNDRSSKFVFPLNIPLHLYQDGHYYMECTVTIAFLSTDQRFLVLVKKILQ